MSTASEKVAATIGAIILGVPFVLGFACYTAFAGGYVAQEIWAWYIVPLGLGLPVLGWKTFFAIGVVKRLTFGFAATSNKEDTRSSTDKAVSTAAELAAPWFALFLAWVLR